ncbi:MAG: MotA/TolQ/ExbB proton channel family protein [Kiritimatiellae bacterium]|jgi:biopolymer transport protein ExbB|nr:MotA/TolQ/ExbB proton channel family protein [Kiritimatiellia bacterium]
MIGYLMDGGWMMLPLLVCSVAMVAVIIDRVRAFRCAAKIDPVKLRSDVCSAVAAGDIDKAVAVCEEAEGPLAAVLLTGLQRLKIMRERGRSEIEVGAGVTKAMEDYAPRSMNGLEKRLGVMVLVASISPLIGMCGTVTGMINSFSVMAEAAGLDPGAVAGGISEALITTAAGLIIAIPGVVAYNMFQKRVEEWNMHLEGAIAEFGQAVGA